MEVISSAVVWKYLYGRFFSHPIEFHSGTLGVLWEFYSFMFVIS